MEPSKEMRLLRDESCPKCEWPEMVTVVDAETKEFIRVECNKKYVGCDYKRDTKK